MPTIPLPPDVFGCSKFTWWRVTRLPGLEALRPRTVRRDVAAELFFEASEDGTGISPGDASLREWTGASRRAVQGAIADLIGMGLVHRERKARSPGRSGGAGRAAEYSLTLREIHVDMLIADGYDVFLVDGGVRKYLTARKRSAPKGAHDSGNEPAVHPGKSSAAQSARDSGMVCNDPWNDVHPRVHPSKESLLQGKSSGPADGALRRAHRPASRRVSRLEEISWDERFAIVQRAAQLRGWNPDDIELPNALAIWEHFIGERRSAEPIRDLVAYFYSPNRDTGIFADFDYIEGLLAVTGSEPEEW